MHELRVQLTTVQGHNKESMEQLAERSRQLAGQKSDLARLQQHNVSMREEVSFLAFSIFSYWVLVSIDRI